MSFASPPVSLTQWNSIGNACSFSSAGQALSGNSPTVSLHKPEKKSIGATSKSSVGLVLGALDVKCNAPENAGKSPTCSTE